MPQFHNPTDNALTFEIAETEYAVPAQGEVEIPERFAYLVKARDMVLRPGPHPKGDAPAAEVREAIPADLEQLLHSPRIPARARDPFRVAWRKATPRQRAELKRELALRAEGRGTGRDEDVDDVEPVPAEAAPTDPAEAAVNEQLGDALEKVGRGRKRNER